MKEFVHQASVTLVSGAQGNDENWRPPEGDKTPLATPLLHYSRHVLYSCKHDIAATSFAVRRSHESCFSQALNSELDSMEMCRLQTALMNTKERMKEIK